MKKRAQGQDKRPTRRTFHSGKRECRGAQQERPEEKNGARVLIWSLLLLSAPPEPVPYGELEDL